MVPNGEHSYSKQLNILMCLILMMVVNKQNNIKMHSHSVEFRPKNCILVLNNGGIGPKASLNLGDSSLFMAGRAQVTSSTTVRVRPAHDRR